MAATLEALAARWRAPRRRDFSDSSSDAALESASAASADSADDSDTVASSSSSFPVSVCDVDFNDGGTAVAGSLFYPARGSGGGAPPPWSPHYYYTYGMADFALRRRPPTRTTRAAAAVMAAVAHLPAKSHRLPVAAACAPPAAGGPFPTVVFSHGLGGSRHAYSAFCAGLAARGYAVLAVEHADGSAAAARVAGAWLSYERWQDGGSQLNRRMRHRASEIDAAARVLGALARGDGLAGLSLGGGELDAKSFANVFTDAPPLLAGHSLGGATVAAAAARTDAAAVVALDPWWGAVPADQTGEWAPLLVVASEEWQRPAPSLPGGCFAGSPDAALAAAATSRGAAWLCLRGSSHACFSDFCARPPRVPGLPPPPPAGLTAPVDAAATVAAAVDGTVAFFEACTGQGRVTAGVVAAVVDAVGEDRVDGLRVVGGRKSVPVLQA